MSCTTQSVYRDGISVSICTFWVVEYRVSQNVTPELSAIIPLMSEGFFNFPKILHIRFTNILLGNNLAMLIFVD